MGLFGPKIVCDQCGKKVKEAGTVYYRGSRFCNDACIGGFDVANPAPVASGDPDKLRGELAMLIREAIAEAERRPGGLATGIQIGANTTLTIEGLPSTGDRTAEDQAAASRQQFQTYVLRAAPILRALGHADVARAIDKTDFMATTGYGLTSALKRVPL